MAKKATPAGATRKRAAAKPKAATARRKSTATAKSAPRKTGRAKAAQPRRAASSTANKSTNITAADALTKLIESPLVADLLAVGATAALAAIAGRGFGRTGGTGNAVKAAGKAAAAAMGRRLTTEVEEIRAASRAKGRATD